MSLVVGPYDIQFLTAVKDVLSSTKLEELSDRVAEDYTELKSYVEEHLLNWRSELSPETTKYYTNTAVGETVSGWITQNRFDDEYIELPLTKELGKLCDDRDKVLTEHGTACTLFQRQ